MITSVIPENVKDFCKFVSYINFLNKLSIYSTAVQTITNNKKKSLKYLKFQFKIISVSTLPY